MGLISFRCDASQRVGGGHLFRCLAIARRIINHSVYFFIKTSKDFDSSILEGFKYTIIPESTCFGQETHLLEKEIFGPVDLMVLDISNSITYEQVETVPLFLQNLKTLTKNIALIDGLKTDSINSRIEDLNVDFYITPYVGSENYSKNGFVHLSGEKYFPLSPVFTYPAEKKKINPVANQILITMGQGDPYGVTLAALKILTSEKLANIIPDLRVEVVIGNFFSDSLKSQINFIQKKFSFIKIIETTANLENNYHWCDLAFSTTGLTKYELAYFGVPSAYVAFNEEMEENHHSFDEIGLSLYLGCVQNFDFDLAICKVASLIKDKDKRMDFSKQSQMLIDGKGAGRIIERILP